MSSDPEITMDEGIFLRKIAMITGIGLLIMAILAPIVHFNILPGIIKEGDAQTTANNLKSSLQVFRLGILFFLIIAILDVIVAWGLYILAKPINKNISLLAAWFRVIYAAVLVVALNDLLNILQFMDNANLMKVFEINQINAQISFAFNSFQSLWEFGLILFSIHLVVLGFLMLRAKYIPKYLGVLIVIAGFGYMIDGIGKIVFSGYNLEIALYTFIGEVVLIFWLFWKGITGFKNI